jgi:hypothetical protein
MVALRRDEEWMSRIKARLASAPGALDAVPFERRSDTTTVLTGTYQPTGANDLLIART